MIKERLLSLPNEIESVKLQLLSMKNAVDIYTELINVAADEDHEYFNESLRISIKETNKLEVKLEKLYNEQGNLRSICRLEGALNV